MRPLVAGGLPPLSPERDRELRRANQRAYPHAFVTCPACEHQPKGGTPSSSSCALCASTRLVTSPGAQDWLDRQAREQEHREAIEGAPA